MAWDSCRKTIKNNSCGEKLEPAGPNYYAPFTVCLPFGRALEWDGTGLRLRGASSVPDGEYDGFTVENGCIVAAHEQPVCDYTPEPCTPAASGCGQSSSGGDGSSDIILIPDADNLMRKDASGRLGAYLKAQGGNNITVTGNGTSSSPLTISFSGSTGTSFYIQSDSSVLGMSGSGTANDPKRLTHREGISKGTYGGFEVDEYGHITGYNDSGDSGISSLVAGNGIKIETAGSQATVSVATSNAPADTYLLGGWNMQFDMTGRLYAVKQVIGLGIADGFALDPRRYTPSINNYGSIAAYVDRGIPFPNLTEDAVYVAELRGTSDGKSGTYTMNFDRWGWITAMSFTEDPAADNYADGFTKLFRPNRNATTMGFTTEKPARFKITYHGLLPLSSAPSGNGYVSLPNAYRVTLNSQQTECYALYNATLKGLTELVVVTDAMYNAGGFTLEIAATADDFTFTDVGVLTVELSGEVT